jgi:hypothetical protein
MTRALTALVLLALAACSDDTDTAPALDRPFKLAYAHEAELESEALTLKFVSVDEESRCPSGVECVWEGQARITLSATKTGAEPASLAFTLHGVETVEYHGYSVQLLQLDPYPSAQHTPTPEEYRATLVVSRDTSAIN